VAELLYDESFEPLEIGLGSAETFTIHQPENLIVMHNRCYLFEFRGRAARSCRPIAPAPVVRMKRLPDGRTGPAGGTGLLRTAEGSDERQRR
jgi:hypothetical protein